MEHRYAYMAETPIDLEELKKDAQLLTRALRATLFCAYCKEEVFLASSSQGEWQLQHLNSKLPEHTPETKKYWQARQILGKRLKELFPGAKISESVLLEDQWVDWTVLTHEGLRMAFHVIMPPYLGVPISERRRRLIEQGIHSMWMLHADYLTARLIKGYTHLQVQLGPTETHCLTIFRTLWYFEPRAQAILRLSPHPGIQDKTLLESYEKGISWVECEVRRYPLSQFRVHEAKPTIMSAWEAPPAHIWRDLPKRISTRREKLNL